jgi:two-component system, cell cycle response regulator
MKPTILLVDDNEDILEFLADELNEKYSLLQARNGQEALDIIMEEVVNLVISDVMMPEMDGFAFCRIIKSNVEYSHVPVILLTAKNTMQSKIKGLEMGADAYIEKPFAMAYLQVQIANLLDNRNKIKDYFAHSPLAHIKSIAHTKSDEHFLDRLNEIIRDHLEETELDVEMLARLMNMSRPTLFRKIKSIADLTPNELVNITRLKKAAELLAEGDHKVYEVSEMVGFNSQTAFGRNFCKQFGMTPTEYQKSKHMERNG